MSATTQSKTSSSPGISKALSARSSPSSENTPVKVSSSEEGPFIQKTRKKRNNKGQNRDVPQAPAKSSNVVQTPRGTPTIPEQTHASTTNTSQPTSTTTQFNNTASSRPISTYGVRGNSSSQHPGGHYNIHNQSQNNNGRSTQKFQTREWTNSMSRKSSLSDVSTNSTNSNNGNSVHSKSATKPGVLSDPEVAKLALPERPSTPSGSLTSRSHSSWASVLKPGLIEVPDGLKADVFGYGEVAEPVEEPTVKRPSTGHNHRIPHNHYHNEVQQIRRPSFNSGQPTNVNALPPLNLHSGTSLLGDVPAHLIPTGMQFKGPPPQEQKGRNSRPGTGSQNMKVQSGRNHFPQNNNDSRGHNSDRKSRRQSKPTMDSQPSYEPQTKKRSNENLPGLNIPPVHVESQQAQQEIAPVAPVENTVENGNTLDSAPDTPNNPSITAETQQKNAESINATEVPEPLPVEDMVVESESSPLDQTTEDPPETPSEKTEPDVHLLETPWTMYHMNQTTKKKGSDWNSGMQPVGVFDTVEAFFHGYHTTPKASETGKNQDYMFFRGGKGKFKEYPVIGAAWEDPKNTDGGLWRFNLPVPRGNTASPVVDFFWKEILMALVGEQFGDHNEMVNGCYFCNRGDEYRVQVWMGCNDPEPVAAVGVRLAELLDLRENFYFDYCSHREIHQKGNRYAKPLHENKEILRMLAAKRNAAPVSV